MINFNKILIANRGEIAVRVIRSARTLGYKSVAVYSQADAQAPHVALADEAVLIGPPPVTQSYLSQDNILSAAAATKADAIHPGYGFLSENAGFAQACAQANIVFIGPSPEAIQLMGNKAEAKRRMIEAGVPCIPGYEDRDQTDETLASAADQIGFPVMIKAAAGGGGRGMRLVVEPAQFLAQLAIARSEAKNAFGSDELILEKALQQARHVEFQIFGDQLGNIIHLGERDCSVQRRHQKVIEEAPCSVMTPQLRAKMGEAAVQAAKSIDYSGAGTIEFMLDQDGNFYFLEMNTRLQVEHPVTEMTTGIDLVAWQLRVARGEPLPIAQSDFAFQGHAMEVRLYAEDPAKNFLPVSGRVDHWQPATGENVRVDHGLASGQEISPFYDPMIAKIIAHGSNRESARQKLIAALQNTMIAGLQTNRDFLICCLSDDRFAAGQATTDFLNDFIANPPAQEDIPAAAPPAAIQAASIATALAALVEYRHERQIAADRAVFFSEHLLDWACAGNLSSRYRYELAPNQTQDIIITARGNDLYHIAQNHTEHHVKMIAAQPGHIRLIIDDVQKTIRSHIAASGAVYLIIDGWSFWFTNLLNRVASAEDGARSGLIAAPMHGRLHRLFVEPGDEVKRGQPLAILEAMKMEHQIAAPIDGQVKNIHVAEDEQIAAGAMMFELTPLEQEQRTDKS